MLVRRVLLWGISLAALLLPAFAQPPAENEMAVIVYDVHAHSFVRNVTVNILPLDSHNFPLSYIPVDPNSHPPAMRISSVTDSHGRAIFEISGLLGLVDKVNEQMKGSRRKLLTPHYEIYIGVLSRGKHCTYAGQSLHQIIETGVVGKITNPPCETVVKPADFQVKPGEIIMFVTHAM